VPSCQVPSTPLHGGRPRRSTTIISFMRCGHLRFSTASTCGLREYRPSSTSVIPRRGESTRFSWMLVPSGVLLCWIRYRSFLQCEDTVLCRLSVAGSLAINVLLWASVVFELVTCRRTLAQAWSRLCRYLCVHSAQHLRISGWIWDDESLVTVLNQLALRRRNGRMMSGSFY
jgi:hypothetical protein